MGLQPAGCMRAQARPSAASPAAPPSPRHWLLHRLVPFFPALHFRPLPCLRRCVTSRTWYRCRERQRCVAWGIECRGWVASSLIEAAGRLKSRTTLWRQPEQPRLPSQSHAGVEPPDVLQLDGLQGHGAGARLADVAVHAGVAEGVPRRRQQGRVLALASTQRAQRGVVRQLDAALGGGQRRRGRRRRQRGPLPQRLLARGIPPLQQLQGRGGMGDKDREGRGRSERAGGEGPCAWGARGKRVLTLSLARLAMGCGDATAPIPNLSKVAHGTHPPRAPQSPSPGQQRQTLKAKTARMSAL